MVYTKDQQKRDLLAAIKTEDDPIKRLQLLGNLVKVASRDDAEVYGFLKTLCETDTSSAVSSFAKRCCDAFTIPQTPASIPKPPVAGAAGGQGGAPQKAAPPEPEIKDERMRRLVELLNHEESSYRLKAVKAVEQVSLVEALPHLIKALRIESSATVIEEMLPVISLLDAQQEHFNDLLPFLRNNSTEIRLAAIVGLDRYTDKRKYRLLISMVDDEDEKIKGAVIKAFAHLSKEELIAELKAMGEAGNQAMKLGVLSFVSHLSWQELNGILVNMAADTDHEVRTRAIHTIAARGDALFLELVSAWIPAAAVSDLKHLSDNLETYDKATKGKRSTDVQILKSRLKRIIEGDDAARNIDVVLSVIKDDTSDTPSASSSAAAAAAAAEKYKKKAPSKPARKSPVKQSSKAAEPAYKARQGKLTDEGILGKLNFLTRIVFFLKIAAVISLFYLGYHHLSPWVSEYMAKAKTMRLESDFKTIASAIKRYEVTGKKFVGHSSQDLVTQGLLQSCQDPWSQPYYLSMYYKSIKTLGADKSEPVTAPVLLTEEFELQTSDDITYYFGTRRPDSLFVSVLGPDGPLLFDVSIDGGKTVDITTKGSGPMYRCSVSPDGEKMTWLVSEDRTYTKDSAYRLYLGSSSGEGGQAISKVGSHFSKVNWSSDSGKLTYSYKSKDHAGLSKVAVYNTYTDNSKVYFPDMPDNDYNPAFSRKDQTLFFTRHLAGDEPKIKQYRDGWVATKDPFDRTVNGDYPFVSRKGVLYYFRGDDDSQELYFIRSQTANEEIYKEGLSMIPPVYISSNGQTIASARPSDYGYVVFVRRADVGKKGDVTYDEYPVFGSPWPIASITRRIRGSVFEETEGPGRVESTDSAVDGGDSYDNGDSGADDSGYSDSGSSSSGTGDDGDIDI